LDNMLDLGFRNINESVLNNIAADDSTETVTVGEGDSAKEEPKYKEGDPYPTQFKCSTQTTIRCEIRQATYALRAEVFNALAAKYISVPMLFPIQQLQVKDFTDPMGTDATADTAATIGINHADSMFIVFKLGLNSRTCFINPAIQYEVNIDGKFYPREQYATIDDQRHINMLYDALNINNSLLCSVSDDLITSQQPFCHLITYGADGKKSTDTTKAYITNPDDGTKASGTINVRWHGKDNSNFMIGIPFADSEDFMGGITTTGTVQIQLRATRIGTEAQKKISFGQPTALFFEDCLLKVRAMKPEGRPQIEITNATIEQLMSGQAK